jgi:hypothetical protein
VTLRRVPGVIAPETVLVEPAMQHRDPNYKKNRDGQLAPTDVDIDELPVQEISDRMYRLAGERSLMGIAGILTDDEADAMRCERPSRSDVSIGARMSKPSPMNSTGPESCFWTRRSSST